MKTPVISQVQKGTAFRPLSPDELEAVMRQAQRERALALAEAGTAVAAYIRRLFGRETRKAPRGPLAGASA
jgi:hypothetical protein